MTDLSEVKMFLGLAIERDREKGVLQIHQEQYLLSLLNRFGMWEWKAAHTPMEAGLKLGTSSDPSVYTIHPYRELVGCLMYVTVTSRPDISDAVNYFSDYQSCATDLHWSHLKRVLRYIRGTVDLKLVFRQQKDDDEDKRICYYFWVFSFWKSFSKRHKTSLSFQ